MISKEFWHTCFLANIAIGISLVAVYSLFDSDVGNRPVAEFVFPQSIPLDNWQQMSREDLSLSSEKKVAELEDSIQSGSLYRYRDNDAEVSIAMYYLTDTRGDVDRLLTQYLDLNSETWQQKSTAKTNLGSYRLVQDHSQTHVAGCLNSMGKTTVNSKQFSTSLNRQGIDLKLLRNWLLGRASIRDRRCLWIAISTESTSKSLFESSEILLPIWRNWLHWWQPHFPSL